FYGTCCLCFFFSSRRRHTRCYRDWSSDVCSSDLGQALRALGAVGLPTTLLIDRGGREIGRIMGPAEWDTPEIAEFLKSVILKQGDRKSVVLGKEGRVGESRCDLKTQSRRKERNTD